MFDQIETLDTVTARELAQYRRRRAVRYGCHLAHPARVRLPGQRARPGRVYNLSVAGVGLLLEAPLEPGTAGEVELFTPAGARAAVQARWPTPPAAPTAAGWWGVRSPGPLPTTSSKPCFDPPAPPRPHIPSGSPLPALLAP
jgi:hypothetical protein